MSIEKGIMQVIMPSDDAQKLDSVPEWQPVKPAVEPHLPYISQSKIEFVHAEFMALIALTGLSVGQTADLMGVHTSESLRWTRRESTPPPSAMHRLFYAVGNMEVWADWISKNLRTVTHHGGSGYRDIGYDLWVPESWWSVVCAMAWARTPGLKIIEAQ